LLDREQLHQLLVDGLGVLRNAVDLVHRVRAEQPHAVRPVAGVVAHRQQEADRAREQVAEQRDDHEPDQEDACQHRLVDDA
jgi:hypothetical protein